MSGVLVVMERGGAGWHRVSVEALAAGQKLAADLGTTCAAAVLGESASTARLAALALAQLIGEAKPQYIVFPHTYQVRDYAPALATKLGEVLISDVRAIHAGPLFVRQWMQGKLNADYAHKGEGVCLLSVQAGSFRADEVQAGTCDVRTFAPQIEAASIRTTPGEPFREAAQTVDLSAAPLIVSVGRGIGEQENLAMVEELAAALGAELAASRPICDAGWLPMERQVGSSGQTVAPKLYLAVGISGAIQHLVGMKGAKTVVAINKDADAPIFEIADIGVVGDLFEIVPALTKAIKGAA